MARNDRRGGCGEDWRNKRAFFILMLSANPASRCRFFQPKNSRRRAMMFALGFNLLRSRLKLKAGATVTLFKIDNQYLHRSPLKNSAIFCLLNCGRQALDQQKASSQS